MSRLSDLRASVVELLGGEPPIALRPPRDIRAAHKVGSAHVVAWVDSVSLSSEWRAVAPVHPTQTEARIRVVWQIIVDGDREGDTADDEADRIVDQVEARLIESASAGVWEVSRWSWEHETAVLDTSIAVRLTLEIEAVGYD